MMTTCIDSLHCVLFGALVTISLPLVLFFLKSRHLNEQLETKEHECNQFLTDKQSLEEKCHHLVGEKCAWESERVYFLQKIDFLEKTVQNERQNTIYLANAITKKNVSLSHFQYTTEKYKTMTRSHSL